MWFCGSAASVFERLPCFPGVDQAKGKEAQVVDSSQGRHGIAQRCMNGGEKNKCPPSMLYEVEMQGATKAFAARVFMLFAGKSLCPMLVRLETPRCIRTLFTYAQTVQGHPSASHQPPHPLHHHPHQPYPHRHHPHCHHHHHHPLPPHLHQSPPLSLPVSQS